MNDATQSAPAGKYLVDSYEDWATGEGVPIHKGAAVDLLTAAVQPWARFDLKGAFCHLDGRDDFLTVFLQELPPNSRSAPQHHLYEEICYVASGTGSTEFQVSDGRTRVIEWGPRSLFAVPMNVTCRHRNTSATPARFAAVNDMRYLFNLYRNENFIFGTKLQFAERYGGVEAIADVAKRASGPLTLAKGTIASDVAELAPGTYRQASRQMHGAHLFGVDGEGYTLAWEEGAQDFARTDWRHGIVTATAGMNFRQHFNPGDRPARYLDMQFGSQQQPLFRHRRAAYGDTTVYAAGNATIPFADQDPLISQQWLKATDGRVKTPKM